MAARDSFQVFCEAYYQLKDILDENNSKLNTIREECDSPLEKVCDTIENELEEERDKILKIHFSKFESYARTKKKRILTKIQEMTKKQEELSEKILSLQEQHSKTTNSTNSGDLTLDSKAMSEMSEKYRKFSKSFKSSDSCGNNSPNDSFSNFYMKRTGAHSLCMNELPENYCKLNRLQEAGLPYYQRHHRRTETEKGENQEEDRQGQEAAV